MTTSSQKWWHYVATSVTQFPYNYVTWVRQNWLTDANVPTDPKIESWESFHDAFNGAGTINTTNANGTDVVPATLEMLNGFNAGDTIQVTGTVDDGAPAAFDETYVVPNTQPAQAAAAGLGELLSTVTGLVAFVAPSVNQYDVVLELLADGTQGYTVVTVSGVTYVPSPVPTPTAETVP